MVDVVIVGAGSAGVSAGRELAARGLSYVILEADDRIGGRAFTDRSSLPGHWDQGCAWFHSADVNPLAPLAETLGWAFEREDRLGLGTAFDSGRWATAQEEETAEAALKASMEAVYAAGLSGQDIPITEAVAAHRTDYVDWVFRLMSSEDPEKISAQGYSDYSDTNVNWIVTQGLGALVERLAIGLDICTKTAVTGITETKGGVRVETTGGMIDAKAVIVTASTNVLLSGAIDFGADHAGAVLDRMQDLPCGAYEKLALAFDQLPFDPGQDLFCNLRLGAGSPKFGFQIVTGPAPKLIAHFGGRDARAAAKTGLEEMTSQARDALGAAFGAKAAQSITGAAMTGWTANPWVQGAYSYARVGAGTARRAMIEANTRRIRFAGEAFSLRWHSTVHGAWTSGKDAASDLATSLTGAR